MNQASLESYLCVYVCNSAVMFLEDKKLGIKTIEFKYGSCSAKFYTKYEEISSGLKFPRQVYAEVEGMAPSLEEAYLSMQNSANIIVPIIAFCANAYIDMPQIWLCFNNKKDTPERKFFQTYRDERIKEIQSARKVEVEVVTKFIDQLYKCKEIERLSRAIGQYHLALTNWEIGKQVLAIEHLFIAAEILTPLVKNKLCKDFNVEELILHEKLNVERNRLDPEIRKMYIFDGDEDCYSKSRKASDAFEHGYETFEKIHELSLKACDKAIRYIRKCILDLIKYETSEDPIPDPYSVIDPLMRGVIQKHFKAIILNNPEEGVLKEGQYPYFEWTYSIDKAEIKDDGKIDYKFNETFKSKSPDKMVVQPVRIEMWGPPKSFSAFADSPSQVKTPKK